LDDRGFLEIETPALQVNDHSWFYYYCYDYYDYYYYYYYDCDN